MITPKALGISAATLLLSLGAFSPLTRAATEEKKAASSETKKLDAMDAKFLKKAAIGGMTEVKLGEVAQKKAKRADVKEFGAMMATDHGKAGDDLKTVASSKGVEVPSDLDSTHKATVDKLSALEGEAFDKAYIKDMVEDHEKDVKEFEQEVKSAKDPEVKAFAEKTLTVIKTHLEKIKAIQATSPK